MKNRILGIVLALSLLAMLIPALPTNAAVNYTGSVATTDNTGVPKDLFFRGDPVYVNVELKYDGVPYSGNIRVELQRTTDGATVSWFNTVTNDPDVGWNNGSHSGWALSTGTFFTGDLMTYDVVAYYTGGGPWVELGREPIVVKAVDMWLDPPNGPYYPGEALTISLVTTHTTDVFYVQIVNSTGATMMNWTGQVALDGSWTTTWLIPTDFPDGAFTINLKDAATSATWDHVHFSVQKYVLMLSPDRSYYLPGETAKITYAVFDTATMTPYVGVTTTFSASWQNLSGNWTWNNGTLSGTEGTQEFVIPTDIALYSNVDIIYWANESALRSFQDDITLYIGLLAGDVSVYVGPYMPGEMVVVDVRASVGGDNLPGASVSIVVERNASAIAAYGASGLSTDLSGTATHTFTLDPSAVVGTYIVNATISKAGYSINRVSNFRVQWDGELLVSFNKAYYNSGDEVVAKFKTIWNNQEVSGYAIAYVVRTSMGILKTGNTNGSDATIAIPADYSGFLEVDASVNINGWILDGSGTVNINFANVVLTSEKGAYRSGETVTFHWEIITTLENATLEWTVTDDDGIKVASGAPSFSATGSFTYNVPSLNPSPSYTAELIVKNPAGGFLTADATVDLIAQYELMVWSGKSSYVSGEFKPGQTVTVHYSISSFIYEQLGVYELVVYTSFAPTSQTVLVTSPSGTIDVAIPDDAPSAQMWISVDLRDPVADNFLDSSMTSVTVNNRLSGWDKSIGGMSAINLTLLILIVIMILLLIIVPYLKGRMGGPKPVKVVEAPPPAPPPSP